MNLDYVITIIIIIIIITKDSGDPSFWYIADKHDSGMHEVADMIHISRKLSNQPLNIENYIIDYISRLSWGIIEKRLLKVI